MAGGMRAEGDFTESNRAEGGVARFQRAYQGRPYK